MNVMQQENKLPFRLAVMPVSCNFFESLFSFHSLEPLFGNFLSYFAP